MRKIKVLTRVALAIALLAMPIGLTGCANNAQRGLGIGTAAGAIGGAIIGHQSGHRTEGALIGGAVGAGTGYIVGNEMDKNQTAPPPPPPQPGHQY